MVYGLLIVGDASLILIYVTGCSSPTYGELIDLLTELEGRPDIVDLLCSKICKQYPNICVSRPMRLFDTIKRIAGPTRPSLRGPAKLAGSPLGTYRKRVWKPHTRATQTPGNN